jgi:secreted trypsin-like serine protease
VIEPSKIKTKPKTNQPLVGNHPLTAHNSNRSQWRTSPQFVMTAAGPDAGREACSGDSGGPLLVGGALVGLVSWGPGKYGCAGTWTAYTSVAYHRKWIAAAASWLPGPGRPVGGGDAMAVEIEDYGDYRDYDYDYEYA